MYVTVPPPSFSVFATIVADTFMGAPEDITPLTTAADVDGWDSISHAILVVAIEDRFGVRFRSEEIAEFTNLGAMYERTLDLIAENS